MSLYDGALILFLLYSTFWFRSTSRRIDRAEVAILMLFNAFGSYLRMTEQNSTQGKEEDHREEGLL